MPTERRLHRAIGTLALVAGAALIALWLAWPALDTAVTEVRHAAPDPARRVCAVVTLAAASALAVIVSWVLLATTCCVLLALRTGAVGTARELHPLLTPWLVRLLVGAALGSGALTGPAAASTAPSSDHAGRAAPAAGELPRLLAGLPLPDRPNGAAARRKAEPPSHAVVPGDSLWSIAEDCLPRGAPPSRVDRGWRALYDANRRLIGNDPHLIRPGTVLRLPGPLT